MRNLHTGRVAVVLAGILVVVAFGFGCSRPVEELPDFDSLWNYQDLAATEQEFRLVLSRAEATGDLAYRLELKTQIARALGLQGKFAQAHRMLDQVELDLGGEPPDSLAVAHIRYLIERGRVINSFGSPEEARLVFEDAWERAQAVGADYHAIDAAHMMGIASPPAEQLAWNRRAMGLAERTQDERGRNWLGPLYHNSGMTCLAAGEYKDALGYFEKEWAQRKDAGKEAGTERQTRIAKWSVAHTLRKLERTAAALTMQRELEAECQEAGEPDGFVFEEIAECLLAQGHKREARPYFQQAYEHLREVLWLKQGEPERIARLRSLGSGGEQP